MWAVTNYISVVTNPLEAFVALTNREKQAAWRARQAENAARLSELERAMADAAERMEAFLGNAGALLFALSEEANHPAAVRRRAKQLQEQVDAVVFGEPLPELAGVDVRRAALISEHATATAPADAQALVRQLRGMR
jgi:hypothetical protein